jgi:hypothetical protein
MRRSILTVRDSRYLVANPESLPSVDCCRPRGILRALRLAALFTALAATPCLAQDANSGSAGPVTTVTMDHNSFIPAEITVVPGTTVTWTNTEAMPPHRGGSEQGVPIEDPGQGRQLFLHVHDRGRLRLHLLDPSLHEGQGRGQAGSQLTVPRYLSRSFQRGNSRPAKSYIFGNKASGRRVSCLAAPIWRRLASQGDARWLRRALRIVDRD